MGRDEMTDVEKEILLLLDETRHDFAALQVSVDECLAEVKKITATIASRPRPFQREDMNNGKA
jgi:hypothetical protein